MKKFSEQGLTLVEVMVSVTILSIVLLECMSFFPQAYLYTKANQSKTIAINIARGALHYFEKQDFEVLQGFIEQKKITNELAVFEHDVSNTNCSAPQTIRVKNDLGEYSDISSAPLVTDPISCQKIISPTINGKTYDKKNIQIFIVPASITKADTDKIFQHIQTAYKNTNFSTVPKTLEGFISRNLETEGDLIIRTIVYVDLNENDEQEGILLEGSIAHESIR